MAEPTITLEGLPEETKKTPEVAIVVEYDKDYKESAVCSEVSWSSLKPYLRQVFGTREGETITGIRVTRTGIRANFKRG